MPLALSPSQLAIIERPPSGSLFLEGPAGTGKTTAGVERLLHLMANGVRGETILVLLPQRNLALPYYDALSDPAVIAGGRPDVTTIGGLSQRMVELFWPLVARQAGFAHPDDPPVFLNLESAQYFMARVVRPLLEEGYFETAAIDRNRLHSQVIDNLNKAALVGFPHTEIGARLQKAWVGENSQLRLYADTQEAANRFRQYCLDHNLLDFSLRVEVFFKYLWPERFCRAFLHSAFHHLIYDNVEEDAPVVHDMVRTWLPDFESALLIYDWDAGYRIFLGADPHSAYQLRSLCAESVAFDRSFVTSPQMHAFIDSLGLSVRRSGDINYARFTSPPGIRQPMPDRSISPPDSGLETVIAFESYRYHPEMLDWVADQVEILIKQEGTHPGEIAILAPYMSDTLRFSLVERLHRRGVPARSHRPSRALRDEPAVRCLLTLTQIAHPEWRLAPTRFDVAYALVQAIDQMDLVRAQLLTEIVYRVRAGQPQLSSFDQIKPEVQARLTYLLGGRYEALRLWLEDYSLRPLNELDYFLSRLFGEVLSQPGFGFHHNLDAGQAAANLIDSARRFRYVAGGTTTPANDPSVSDLSCGKEYVMMVLDGVVAAQYLRSWESREDNAVLLTPAYTFLMSNRPVDYQFWLDISGHGWSERLYQPLTHPYVLSRRWPLETPWTDAEEYASSQESLYRLMLGLALRCRRKIFLGLSELGERGDEHKGRFLNILQRILRSHPADTLKV